MIEPGELLRLARAEKKWSQRDLANAAGVSRGVVSKIEGGDYPTWRTLAKVLAAAGLDLAPIPARDTTFEVDARICAFLMSHPLDRLALHGLPSALIAQLELDVRLGHPVLTGPSAAFFWLPPGFLHVGVPAAWDFSDDVAGATYPVRPDAASRSIRVSGPRELLAAALPLGPAARVWDELIDRDLAGRRDAAHRDPGLDDRAIRAQWPAEMEQNVRAGRDLEWYRQPPWAIRRRQAQAQLTLRS